MNQLGIKQEEIDAERVIIEKSDGKIIIEEPSVVKINMQGQETFQISGIIKEERKEEGKEEEDKEIKEQLEKDISTVMEKTSCSEEQAKKALEESNGDLAEAILILS